MVDVENPRDFDEHLAHARSLSEALDTDEQWDALFDGLRKLIPFGRRAFDAALALLAGDSQNRAFGCHLLSVLCNPDEVGWSHEAAEAIMAVAERETADDVIWAVVNALGFTEDVVAVPYFVSLQAHPDRDIRLRVAQQITGCRTWEDDEDIQPIVNVLLGLMEDDDPEVRNWATFGIGTQLDVDGPDVRNYLLSRVVDTDPDARMEAIVGLARRHDAAAFAPVLAELRAEDPQLWAVESAKYLGDSRLLQLLQRLAKSGATYNGLLADALDRCDPLAQARELTQLEELFIASELDGLPNGSSLRAMCNRIENRVDLEVRTSTRRVLFYGLNEFVGVRCAGDISRVLAAIAEDVANLETSSDT